MNVGFVACIILVVLFLVLGILFAILKEKGAYFVSGFRTLNHPEKYDKASISLDMRNQCFTYSLILFLGAILSYFISAIIAIPTYVIWGIVFFLSLSDKRLWNINSSSSIVRFRAIIYILILPVNTHIKSYTRCQSSLHARMDQILFECLFCIQMYRLKEKNTP